MQIIIEVEQIPEDRETLDLLARNGASTCAAGAYYPAITAQSVVVHRQGQTALSVNIDRLVSAMVAAGRNI
jgi:hypothetical protein